MSERDEARVDQFNALGASAFEQLGEITPADDALLDRLVDNAVTPAPAPAATSASGLGAKVLIAAVATSAVVAGALWWQRGRDVDPPPVPAPVVAPSVEEPPASVPEQPAVPTRVEPTARPVEVEAAPDPAPDPAPSGSSTKPAKPRVAPAPPRYEDPAALLVAANRARRAKQSDEARALYRELAERFPGTREHRISRVALGDLELEHYRRPAEALEQYDAYLRAKPKGNLAEEALFGKARALDELSREADGAEAWAQLLERFPDSLHAPAAKRRLNVE